MAGILQQPINPAYNLKGLQYLKGLEFCDPYGPSTAHVHCTYSALVESCFELYGTHVGIGYYYVNLAEVSNKMTS